MTSPKRPTWVESTRGAAARYAKLAVRRGISLGALRSGNARDFAIVLAAAAQPFRPGCQHSEVDLQQLAREACVRETAARAQPKERWERAR